MRVFQCFHPNNEIFFFIYIKKYKSTIIKLIGFERIERINQMAATEVVCMYIHTHNHSALLIGVQHVRQAKHIRH